MTLWWAPSCVWELGAFRAPRHRTEAQAEPWKAASAAPQGCCPRGCDPQQGEGMAQAEVRWRPLVARVTQQCHRVTQGCAALSRLAGLPQTSPAVVPHEPSRGHSPELSLPGLGSAGDSTKSQGHGLLVG